MTEDYLKPPSNCSLLALSVSVRALLLLTISGVKNDPSCLFLIYLFCLPVFRLFTFVKLLLVYKLLGWDESWAKN